MTSASPHRSKPKLLPHPRLSVLLFAVWLLATNVWSPGAALMAGIIAWGIPWLTREFWPHAPTPRHPLLAFGLFLVFFFDIVIANFSVALRVVRANHHLRPAFVELPLDLQDDFGIAILAAMITLTPGTVSADVSPDRKFLFIHVLDTSDPPMIVRKIKSRYEARLARILGC